MDNLFSRMMSSLSNAVARIEAEMSKLFSADRISLTDDQWTEYGDNRGSLQNRSKQLNHRLHFEYEFEENLANDVITYSKLLNDSRPSCEELVGYLLSRNDEAWTKDETGFLKDVLQGIINHSDRITRLLK